MKNYHVILSKSYIVEIEAKSGSEARKLAEIYTSNIIDISTDNDRRELGFGIRQITCGLNETFEVNEVTR